MGDISAHFSRKEFACSDNCGFNACDIELVDVLEKVRERFGRPVIVHCGCRCLDKNKSVGSKDTSKHIRGIACDFHIDSVTPLEIAGYLETIMPDFGGIGVYKTFNHVDIRDNKARWNHA